MLALGHERSKRRRGVIITTTTKIWEPAPSSHFVSFVSLNFLAVQEWIAQNLSAHPCLLIGRARLPTGKLEGVPADWVEEIIKIPDITTIIVEADGAQGHSLKAPREGEPVVPLNTTLLVPVVGIDALGCPLDEDHVFRWKIAMEILREPAGTILNEKMIARLLAATIQGRPEGARVIPFINKIDLLSDLEGGRKLGQALLNIPDQEIKRVVLGQAQKAPIIKAVMTSGRAEGLKIREPLKADSK
jgi:probable selenium-dependent hydroxylase accessory protein YqeC